MYLTRILLLGLASLNCVWALANFLTEYLRIAVQSLNPFRAAEPFDSAALLIWLAVALASGIGAFMILRASRQEQRRIARIIALPDPEQQTPNLAA